MRTLLCFVLIVLMTSPICIMAQNNKIKEVKTRVEPKALNRLDRRIDQREQMTAVFIAMNKQFNKKKTDFYILKIRSRTRASIRNKY